MIKQQVDNGFKQDISKPTAVVAVGGNSLIVSKDKQAIPDQYEAVVKTVRYIVDMIENDWNIIITHGSGPQVGFVLRRSEIASSEVSTIPIDYADADIQGAVGYMFQRAISNEFTKRKIDRTPVTIVTQVLVDAKDEAFEAPSKPIGPYLEKRIADLRAKQLGWTIKEESGRGWRRVVPSPRPQKILEIEQIKTLIGANAVVIACGGGGIPVIKDRRNMLSGVEAVIDKDLASGVLASELSADLFIISTNVEKVAINYRTSDETWLDSITLAEAKLLHAEGQFHAGSMGPKVEAMIHFLENGGEKGVITKNEKIRLSLQRRAGTIFSP